MRQRVDFAWEITEEGCFKMPLVRLPGEIYKGEDTVRRPVTDYLHEDHSIHMYETNRAGTYWCLKPEYL